MNQSLYSPRIRMYMYNHRRIHAEFFDISTIYLLTNRFAKYFYKNNKSVYFQKGPEYLS